ncbi:MAG: chitobiase/beta-hexosaminidase C-terminal domain-containing protein, partial [Myxococcota bacterium]
DCSEGDAQLWRVLTGYVDGDDDGRGVGAPYEVCAGETLPVGFAASVGDCDDGDVAVWTGCVGCTDSDGDGYGMGCPNGDDCADGDGAVYQLLAGYVDVDGDGDGSGASVQVCSGVTLPTGYAATGGDLCDLAADAPPLVVSATPPGGLYGAPQSVTLSADPEGATIYYTLGGSTPTTSSAVYVAPIGIDASATLKVVAADCAGHLTAVVTESYTIDTASFLVSASPAGGSYPGAQYITLSANAPVVAIYYTADGTTPTTSSKLYTNPIATGAATTLTLKFFAQDAAGSSSAVSQATYILGGVITDLKIVNTGGAQTSVPITFGQVFVEAEVPAGTSVAGTLSSGASIPLQVNVKATHGDGSVRHAIISAVLPTLASGQTETLSLSGESMGSTAAITPSALLAAGFTASVEVTLGATTYSAAANTLLAGAYTQWLSGPIVNEWIVSAPLKTAGNVAHPHLAARFAIRSYAGSNKTKVDVAVENTRTFTAGPQNFTYDAKVFVGGVQVDTITALEHYHHARWHKVFWWGTAPQVHLKHHTDYLLASKAVPNYDRSVVPAESAIAGLVTQLTADKVGPMKVGLALPYMPNTGGRPDIGPLPGWYALYLLSMDARAKDAMLKTADGSGSWSMHYRDESDANDMPVRIDKAGNEPLTGAPYRDITTNSNLEGSGPLPVPRCAGGSTTLCVTPLTHDASHQPGLAYLPYLVTGDYYYLEELQFWAAWNPLGTSAVYRNYEDGWLKWDQPRAQAWGLRTLGQVAYITPDAHSLKQYFHDMVVANLAFYDNIYTVGAANQLGVIDGQVSGFKAIHYPSALGVDTGISTFQDDFITWSVGYLDELGYSEASSLLAWKSKFPVERMTNPALCWTVASVFVFAVRPTATSPLYTSLADAYLGTFGSLVGVDSTSFIDKECGSQDQADWLTQNSGTGFIGEGTIELGEMIGYSDQTTGFPSNMQIALAVAATSGIPSAREAWLTFMSRSVKPDYSLGPQFAVVPRN